jgi:glycosyltransferase involved in cell wall biosynthesis
VVHIFENKDDRFLFNRLGIVPKAKSVSIKGCGVDVHHFKPNCISPDHTGGKVVFSYIGRLVYDKGIKEFVQAAEVVKRRYPQAEFWLVGKIDTENPTAISRQDLMRWTENGTIVYKGYTDDVREWIGLSDCIVLPSYREGMPRTLKEGMAMGKPLITTNTPGCREAVEHMTNGFLVPLKDSAALAEAMLHFIYMPAIEKEKMGKAGRAKAVDEFDDKKIASQIFEIVQKLVVPAKVSV